MILAGISNMEFSTVIQLIKLQRLGELLKKRGYNLRCKVTVTGRIRFQWALLHKSGPQR